MNKQEQTTYDKLGGFHVIANKLSKFQFARAFIAIVALFSLVFWLSFSQTEKDTSVQKVITAPPYHWQNPVTKADAVVSAEWKNTFEKNEQGQPIYTFSEVTNYALVVLALESRDEISLNTYVDLLRKGVENTMKFNDGGRYLEKDGIQVWECLGTMESIDGSLLQVEVRKNGSDFWRIVSVQAKPYDYTDAKVEELKFQLWKTVTVNPVPLQ